MLQKAALITGASSGIGAALSTRLDQEGFQILLVGRDSARLRKVSENLKNPSFCLPTDLEDKEATDQLAHAVLTLCQNHHLSLKALIHAAGVFERTSFESTALSTWEKDLRVNLLAPVQLTLKLGEKIKQDQSVIVNISSTLGLRPVADTSAYSASKAALNNWTQSLALEWAKDGVRVVGICPGLVDTPIHPFHGAPEKDPTRQKAHQAQPLGRMGTPEDIAHTVSFLVSEEASWITGSLWNVDGGISLL
jgi:NAD(P)-dependent dehydrogenase (short-subunit alcohol dehydrogenase family)